MAFAQGGRGYDRAITVFSPDGKLFQVQYAQEAVKRGYTALGIKTKSGVVLAAERRTTSELVEDGSVEKIFKIDKHIGAAASGLIADARVLIDRARVEAQVNRIRYDELISVESLAKTIGDTKQMYTQHGGVRPFGTRFLIGGVGERGPHLFETDPSGVVAAYKAHAIGGGADEAIEVLEKNYEREMNLEESTQLALRVLGEVIEGELKPEKVEMAKAEAETQEFLKMTDEEISETIDQFKSEG
ncbi:proteasome subunit alpha [candidate division MSBL1 archaeon SCGC-AAA259D18]|uniref:Proteasome subunit alpha n=2 Tax=candidate division MSBL1 TaxID=215777 RepID=A0A133UB76_9EURY|nr:proteasome subunit alpha [candidate division MSBL1 archaeon SCGC-AAA259D18]KXA91452.1 proteasome subunit alpha [candidate division MSBL1 archaeon SCGC-AAA259A05]